MRAIYATRVVACTEHRKVAEAKQTYEDLLAHTDPGHPDEEPLKAARPTEDAVPVFRQAIALDANNASYYNNRGLAYYRLENYEASLADFNLAICLLILLIVSSNIPSPPFCPPNEKE